MTIEQIIHKASNIVQMICHKCDIREYYYTLFEAHENGWQTTINNDHICPYCLEKMSGS